MTEGVTYVYHNPALRIPSGLSGSLESDKDLRIAFECLHYARSYAHFLVTTKRTPPGMTVATATKQVKQHIRSRIHEYYNTCNRFSVQYLCRDKELVLYKVAFNSRYSREDSAGLLYGSWDRLLPPGRTTRVKWVAHKPRQQAAYVWLYGPYYRITNYN